MPRFSLSPARPSRVAAHAPGDGSGSNPSRLLLSPEAEVEAAKYRESTTMATDEESSSCEEDSTSVSSSDDQYSTSDDDDDDDDEPPAKVSGVGRVFVHFADQGSACAAQRDLNFRHFGTSLVRARFYPETEFQAGNYGADADPPPISVTL